MTIETTLTSTLQQANMRLTPQRLAICKLLAESDEHPTAARIYDLLRPSYPSLSLATVYNTLETLVNLGVVNVLGHIGDDHVHYDADIEPHINLACVSCHRIIDIQLSNVAQMDTEISLASGYKLLGARVLYFGLCPECQKHAEKHSLSTQHAVSGKLL